MYIHTYIYLSVSLSMYLTLLISIYLLSKKTFMCTHIDRQIIRHTCTCPRLLLDAAEEEAAIGGQLHEQIVRRVGGRRQARGRGTAPLQVAWATSSCWTAS